MLSNVDAGFQILQDQLNIGDSKLVEFGKQLTQDLLKVFTSYTGVQNENEEDIDSANGGFSPSPYKKSITTDSMSPRRNTSEFNNHILDKYDQSEQQLITLKKAQKVNDNRIIDLESENQQLKDQLGKKTSELEKLAFENEDFKKRANLGMTEILELELNQKKEQIVMLSNKLEEKQKEYSKKIEDYHEKYEENRRHINDLEEYRTKYDELKSQQNEGSKDQVSDEQLKQEYER